MTWRRLPVHRCTVQDWSRQGQACEQLAVWALSQTDGRDYFRCHQHGPANGMETS